MLVYHLKFESRRLNRLKWINGFKNQTRDQIVVQAGSGRNSLGLARFCKT